MVVGRFTTRYAMPQEWITDRPPTEADGDMDGDVNMVTAPGADFDDYVLVHWSYVGDAAPWQHTKWWKPPAEPTPTEPTPTEPDRIASRRVVQIAFDAVDAETSALIALCDDGSMWCSATGSPEWTELPAIPQP
jgi:hypothetical protein